MWPKHCGRRNGWLFFTNYLWQRSVAAKPVWQAGRIIDSMRLNLIETAQWKGKNNLTVHHRLMYAAHQNQHCDRQSTFVPSCMRGLSQIRRWRSCGTQVFKQLPTSICSRSRLMWCQQLTREQVRFLAIGSPNLKSNTQRFQTVPSWSALILLERVS